MVLSDKRNFEAEPNHENRPDEVRIYDIAQEHGHEELLERFRFRPKPTREVGQPTQWRFRVRRISDLTHEGEQAVVGYFTENRADESTLRPVLIHWDDQTEEYTITSLIPEKPFLVSYPQPGVRTVGFTHEYDEEETLEDARSGVSVATYPTSAFAVRGNFNGINTLAAFFLSVGGPGKPVIELANFQTSLFYKPKASQCEPPYVLHLTSLYAPLSEHSLIAEAHRVTLAEC